MIMFGGDVDLEREGSGCQKGQTGAKKYHNTNRALTLYKNKTVRFFVTAWLKKTAFLFFYTLCLSVLCFHAVHSL